MTHAKRWTASILCWIMVLSFFAYHVTPVSAREPSAALNPSLLYTDTPSQFQGVALFREKFGRVYSAPTEDSMILDEIITKENFLYYSFDTEWTCILYHGLPAYMKTSLLTFTTDRNAPLSHMGIVQLKKHASYLYPYPSDLWTDPLYGIPLAENSPVTLLGICGSWAEISIQDETGFVPSSSLAFIAENTDLHGVSASPYVSLTETSRSMWEYFLDKGLSEEVTAALLGNIYAESALNTMNLQNSFEETLGYTDLSYTNAVNSGTYSRSSFIYDGAGYGLCQWTSPYRKDQLYAMAAERKVGIANLELQLDIIWEELNSEHAYLLSYLQYPLSLRQASDIVLSHYMVPAIQNDYIRNLRLSYCLPFYEAYR